MKIILWLVVLVFAWSIFDTKSRAASLGVVLVSINIGWLWLIRNKSKIMWIAGFLCLCMLSISTYINPPAVVKKHLDSVQRYSDSGSPRERIRRFSYFAFRTSPLLGIGFSNFNKLTIDSIKEKVIDINGNFDESLYLPQAHAHNIYYTYLVSGGVTVTFVFLWFWGWLALFLFSMRNKLKNIDYCLWSSSIGVLLINLGMGMVNTSFHHEVAIFSMVIIALFVGDKRQNSFNL